MVESDKSPDFNNLDNQAKTTILAYIDYRINPAFQQSAPLPNGPKLVSLRELFSEFGVTNRHELLAKLATPGIFEEITALMGEVKIKDAKNIAVNALSRMSARGEIEH